VEVELTPKRDRTDYDRKLAWYMGQLDYPRCTGLSRASRSANGS
jgi:hypothetical protein